MADIPHTKDGPRIHGWRHTLAVENLRRWSGEGLGLANMAPYLTAYLGHQDFRATQYYLRLTALHSFFRYLQKQSPPDMEAIQGILDIPYKKTAMAVVPYLNEGQMQALLSVPGAGARAGFRDQTLLSLLYDTGARVQELAGLKVKDIRIEPPSVVTLHGKGNKTRQVPIMTNTRKLLKAYLERYRYDPGISKGDNQLFHQPEKGETVTLGNIIYH